MLGLASEWRLKRETESLLLKARIDKSQGDSLFRMCRKVDESINHIVSGCSKLQQKEYKRRHDNLGNIVYWKFLENVILKLEINGMNMSQKVF